MSAVTDNSTEHRFELLVSGGEAMPISSMAKFYQERD